MPRRRRPPALLLAALLLACMPPSWGANALLHPYRRAPSQPPALPHEEVAFESDGATLRGWRFPARGTSRGVTLVYLHGIADTRASGTWLAERFTLLGFDVLAYDARAHGASGGDACTYGVLERRDLSRALDATGATRAVLLGVSLGAAVALQAAAEDPRVSAVVAVAPFADLESVARERAPWFASEVQIRDALALAERDGGFRVADASPLLAAPRIHVPVLVVHGARDRETSPDHARRVAAALGGPMRLRIVEGAGHSDALAAVIDEVEAWVTENAEAPGSARPAVTPTPPPGPRPTGSPRAGASPP